MQIFALFAVSRFYSRVVLKKVQRDVLLQFRSVEKTLKKYSKLKADIVYNIDKIYSVANH